MSGYTKLFSSIVTSTIWDEDSETRVVWITLLALAEFDGRVMASMPGLAHQARVSREACERAVAKFEAPDPDSRSSELEGRRILKIKGGWQIVNHTHYQRLMNEDERAERRRDYMRGYMKEKREDSQVVNSQLADVNSGKPCKPHSDSDSDTDKDSDKNKTPLAPLVLPDWLPVEAWDNFKAHRAANKRRHGPLTERAEKIALKALSKLRDNGCDPVEIIETTIVRGWASFFPPHERNGHGNGKSDKFADVFRAIDEA